MRRASGCYAFCPLARVNLATNEISAGFHPALGLSPLDNPEVPSYKCTRFRLIRLLVTENYTLIDVEKMTGAERFAIQLWAREGLLQPISDTQGAGRGVPRRFSLAEVELAALMGRLARYCSLNALRVFAKKYRARATGEKFENTKKHQLIDAARNGDSHIYLCFILNDANDGSLAIFRWDQKDPYPPERLSSATDAIIVNLVRTWSNIRERASH